MKKVSIVTLFFVLTLAAWAQELTPVLGPLIQVNPTNVFGSTRPRIALANDTVPIVMWSQLGPPVGHMWVARWNGTGFDGPVMIAPYMDIYTSNDEGGDIAAWGDTAYIVFFTTDSKCYCVHSYDAGMSWSDTVRIDHILTRKAYTPNVEIDRTGNPVILFESSDSNILVNNAQMVCRSYDGGNSFTMEQPVNLNVTAEPCECCPPELLINDSMVYAIYRNNDNNVRNIVMTISSDSGMTFPVVSEVDQTNWTLSGCPTAGADAGFYRDSVAMIWKSANKIWIGCGHAQTGMEGPYQLLEPSLAASVQQRHPVIETGGDTIVYLWDDRRNSNTDCYIAIRGNGVGPVTGAFILNDTAGLADIGTQQCPHAVMSGNKIYMVYDNSPQIDIMFRVATVGGPSGVADCEDQTGSVAVYPVPAGDAVNIRFSSVAQPVVCTILIHDVSGKLVETHTVVSPETEVDISALAPGAYTLQVVGEDFNSVTKIIKE